MAKRRIRTSNNELTQYLKDLRRQGFEVTLAGKSTHYHIRRGKQLLGVIGSTPANPHTSIKKTQNMIEINLQKGPRDG